MSDNEICAFVWQREYRKRWVTYSNEEMLIINKAVREKQKSISLSSTKEKKTLILNLDEMIQKNKVTLYEQRIRCLVPHSGCYVWLWRNDKDEWCCCKPYLAFFLEVAIQKSEKSLKFYDNGDFVVDLNTFEQLNEATLQIIPIKRESIQLSITDAIKDIELQNEAIFKKMMSGGDLSSKRIRFDSPSAVNSDTNLDVNAPSCSFNPMDIDDSKLVRKRESTSDNHSNVPVDSECPESENFHIYCEGKITYSATLNQTNLQNNNNKFYIIQLLEHNQKKQFAVWRRWARVGNRGQTDLSKYGTSLQEAKKSFESKFYDKTRNDWNELEHFVHVRGKYDLLHMDLNPESEVKKMKRDVKSKLTAEIKSLMDIICDEKRMEEMMKDMSYDCKKTPLGKLTMKQVQDGYIALNKISTILSAGGKGSALLNACNDFYTKIPHNFGMKTPPIIRTQNDIDDKLRMLEALSNITVAMEVLNTTSNKIEHPLDNYYASLNCLLKALSLDSPEYLELEKILKGTHGLTHTAYEMEIINAFSCHKLQEEASFIDSNNKFLLWHGSRITNWLGILKQGLRIAPPEAPCTGYMFGKGIYFADVSSKSANYCCASRRKNEGILLLCEVSVGNQYPLTVAEGNLPSVLPSGYDSTLGKGHVTPIEFKTSTLSSEAKAPFGPLIDNEAYVGCLIYNEYIVYDVNRVKMRYLLRIKFNYI